MIIVVSGVSTAYPVGDSEYKREFYQPVDKTELKENIKKDFGDMLSVEMSKLKIDVLI